MGLINGFIQASAVLASQAQQVAGRLRSRRQADQEDQVPADRIRPRVDGVELSEAVQELPDNRSEQSRHEHQQREADGHPRGVRKVDLRI
ncbi:MAG: hypothetical protein CMJ40_03830 [Phycisphaerae bacterium]|nr:hypothetical protein [Phycisphaerae bacterium]